MFDIGEELKKLPNSPGVYLMKDKSENVIYVGKSKNLRQRVRSYFRKRVGSRKIEALVNNINSFEYILVDSEAESLILESNYIKEYKPRYNVLLRDDKEYPFIKLTNEKFPSFVKVRENIVDGSTYFGPFPNAYAVNSALKWWEIVYDVNVIIRPGDKNSRKYLNYFLKDKEKLEDGSKDVISYKKKIENITNFLNGTKNTVIEDMTKKMLKKAEDMEYEEAGELKEAIEMMEYLKEEQKVTTPRRNSSDFVAFHRALDLAIFVIFIQRDGKIVSHRNYLMEVKDSINKEDDELFYDFMTQYYVGLNHLPTEIVLEIEPKNLDLIKKALEKSAENRTKIVIPKIGEKKRIINMVKKNAIHDHEKHLNRLLKINEKKDNALYALAKIIGTGEFPQRIESFDISHIQGTDAVGAMVVFKNGLPTKTDYRRFKIKTANPKDDVACMKEVLERRYLRLIEEQKGFSNKPDLILMDGGKNQINACEYVLRKLGINIPVMGMVKDLSHKTRSLLYENQEYELKEYKDLFNFISEVQNEVHRFAISFHKSLRGKSMLRSQLDGIKGIGEKRKKILLDHYGSISKIKKASVEELSKIPGMNKPSAISVKEELNDYTIN